MRKTRPDFVLTKLYNKKTMNTKILYGALIVIALLWSWKIAYGKGLADGVKATQK